MDVGSISLWTGLGGLCVINGPKTYLLVLRAYIEFATVLVIRGYISTLHTGKYLSYAATYCQKVVPLRKNSPKTLLISPDTEYCIVE